MEIPLLAKVLFVVGGLAIAGGQYIQHRDKRKREVESRADTSSPVNPHDEDEALDETPVFPITGF
tara:strand:- start:115 stop:309 length:195 start_codon:yes stop_codon:yes gene_type:complete